MHAPCVCHTVARHRYKAEGWDMGRMAQALADATAETLNSMHTALLLASDTTATHPALPRPPCTLSIPCGVPTRSTLCVLCVCVQSVKDCV